MDIFTIINLLSIISNEYHELRLISELNNFFDFDHNLLLLDSNADINRFVNINKTLQSTPQSVHVFKQQDNNNITGLDQVKEIYGKNVLLVIVSERNTFQSNLHLLIEMKKIQRLKTDVKIGIFFPRYESNDDIRRFFEWCWTEKIINIFATFYLHPTECGDESLLHIFSYNPFGTLDVTNVTGSREFGKIFLEKNFNFHQHRLTFADDVLINSDTWQLMLPILNATAVVCDNPYENCSVEIYGYDLIDESRRLNIYPVYAWSTTIVVPKAVPYKGFVALFRAATSDNIFIATFITTTTTILFLYMARHRDKKRHSFFKSVADVLNLLMNDNDGIIYQNLSRIEVVVVVPLTFAGFVIVNSVLSALQSHLTRPFLQPQINSIEELYRSPLPIFTFTDAIAGEMLELLEKVSPHGDWKEKIRATNNFTDLILGHIAMYDTSIAFVSELPFANGLLRVQEMFNIQGYHITPITAFKKLTSYVVDDDFPFADRINDMIHRIESAGFLRIVEAKYDKVFVNFFAKFNYWKRIPLSEEEFPVPIAIAFGWIASIIVFVIEIVWKKYNLPTKGFMKTQAFFMFVQCHKACITSLRKKFNK